MTGVLKILTVNGACAFRVAHTGCLPLLLQLKDHPNLPLRRNCHIILSNAAYVKENEPYLAQMDMPDEFVSSRRLQLSDDEAAAVSIDFAEVESHLALTKLSVYGHLFYLSPKQAQALAKAISEP